MADAAGDLADASVQDFVPLWWSTRRVRSCASRVGAVR